MKITKEQLQQIIKEEAAKYKKVLELEKRKSAIVKQLNEMYEDECYMEEGLGDTKFGQKLGFKSDEQKRKDALDYIMSHPSRKEIYLSFDPEKRNKLIEFFVKNPGVKYFSWDDAKKQFVTTGSFGVASGEGLSGK